MHDVSTSQLSSRPTTSFPDADGHNARAEIAAGTREMYDMGVDECFVCNRQMQVNTDEENVYEMLVSFSLFSTSQL